MNFLSSLLKSGDLVLDVEQHLATFKGQQIELSNREWAILIPLVSHPNKIFSKANLEDKLYDFDSEIAKKYIVRGIPAKIVIDKEGNIISVDSSEENIKALIEENK